MSTETADTILESIQSDRQMSLASLAAEERAQGFHPVLGRRRDDPRYLERVAQLTETIARYVQGRLRVGAIEEAMSTSDFPQLFGDIIDRTLLGRFREYDASYPLFTFQRSVRDFRTAKMFTVNGAEGQLPDVAQGADYEATSISDEQDTVAVTKKGIRMPFVWEAYVNDDLGAFLDNVGRLGRSARRTRQKKVTALYVDANGPHASLYTAGNANIINTANGASATNPALSTSGLIDGLVVLGAQTDSDSEPIMFDVVTLVVPPHLAPVAMNIVEAVELRLNDRGGTSNELLIVRNWIGAKFRVAVDPYIPIVGTTNGKTSWFLFGNPADARPALVFASLRGHEEPQTFLKAPNAVRVGGGEISPFDGSFENDSIEYKIREVYGVARITAGAKSTVASNGSGA